MMLNLAQPPCTSAKKKMVGYIWGVGTLLNSLHGLIMQCAKSWCTEWICLLSKCVAQIYPTQRVGNFRCQVQPSVCYSIWPSLAPFLVFSPGFA